MRQSIMVMFQQMVRTKAPLMFSVILSGLYCVSGAAQGTTPQLLGRASELSYVLGAGDQLNIHVVDLEEYADKTATLDPDGDLDLPLVGKLHVVGDTLDEFKTALRRRLKKYITNPSISITLIANRSSRVSVVGEVNSPGVRELSGPTTLIEAISTAGGLRADAGSKVILTRSLDSGRIPIDGQVLDETGMYSTVSLPVDDLMNARRPADNLQLRAGDVVFIPKAAIIYVVGDVHKSGGFPIPSHSSMSVLQAVSLAEGLTNNNASRSAKIIRPNPGGEGKPTEIPVNIQAIFAGKAPDPPAICRRHFVYTA